MGHTLGTAAKATGMSRTAILRAIGKGKISAKKNDHGEWDIDPAELHRLYPLKQPDTVSDNGNLEPHNNTGLAIENAEMKAKLEAAEQRVRDKDTVIDDLRRRLDAEGEERRRLTAILTDQRTKTPAAIITPPPEPAAVPAPAVVKQVPPNEASWFRRMMGGK
jgi:hypothetical protein